LNESQENMAVLHTVVIPAFDNTLESLAATYLRRIVSRFIGARVSMPNFL